MRPTFSMDEAGALARRLYGIRGSLSPLPADRDQNFRLATEDGEEFVLKIFRSGEDPALLACQDEVMERLTRAELPYRFPTVRPTLSGARVGEAEAEAAAGAEAEAPAEAVAEADTAAVAKTPEAAARGRGGGTGAGADRPRHLVRLVEWIPGTPLASVPARPPGAARDVGRLLGALDRVLGGYRHPAADRPFEWDLRRARDVVDRDLAHVEVERRPLVERFHRLFRERVEPIADRLPLQVIHGDGNDHNILVGAEPGGAPRIAGLVDFGDLVLSWRVGEAAVASAYALLDQEDPLAVVAGVAEGYHRELPLTGDELRALFPLTLMRLCVSVVHSARRGKEHPDDPYLRVSEAPAWRALERLAGIDPGRAEAELRNACGLGVA